MKIKPKKQKPEPFNLFWCGNCENHEGTDVAGIKKHLQEVHGITGELRGNRSMLMHMDCEDCYYWDYEWTIGDVRLIQKTCNLRKEPWSTR